MNSQDNGNFIYIFDLKRIPKKNKDADEIILDYEFSYNPNKADLYIKKKGIKKFDRKE